MRRSNILRGVVNEAINKVLSEEIDTGQVPSAWEKKHKKQESPEEREIRAKIRKLRRKISEYEEDGRDISGLQRRIAALKKKAGYTTESRVRGIVHETMKRMLTEARLFTGDINVNDLRVNGVWNEDGYIEWEAKVDNGWYTFRGTYNGFDCELDEIIEGHSGHGHQIDIDDEAIEWFDNNLADNIKAWLDEHEEDLPDSYSNIY